VPVACQTAHALPQLNKIAVLLGEYGPLGAVFQAHVRQPRPGLAVFQELCVKYWIRLTALRPVAHTKATTPLVRLIHVWPLARLAPAVCRAEDVFRQHRPIARLWAVPSLELEHHVALFFVRMSTKEPAVCRTGNALS